MKYKTIGVNLSGNLRNDVNDNFAQVDIDIKALALQSGDTNTNVAQALLDAADAKVKANEAKTTAEGISATASEAKTTATEAAADATIAKTTAETVQSEFDLVIAEAGSNNPEVVQARGEFTNLKGRLDSTAQQLADKAERLSVDAVTNQIENIISQSGTSDTETVDARTTLTGNVKPTLKSRLDESEELDMLYAEYIKGTSKTPSFVGEKPSKMTHERTSDNVILRTDDYTFTSDTVIEKRTLYTGKTITLTTNLNTLQTEVI